MYEEDGKIIVESKDLCRHFELKCCFCGSELEIIGSYDNIIARTKRELFECPYCKTANAEEIRKEMIRRINNERNTNNM